MVSIDNGNKARRKWWLHPMDLENVSSDRRNAKSYNHWLLIWGVMFFGVVLGMEPLPGGVEATPVWRMLLAFSPVVPGIFLIRAGIRLYSETKDDLIRKIHYKALAVGFLCAFVIGMCFELLAVITGVSDRAGPFMFAGLLSGYFIALVLSYRKYNV